MRTSTSTIRRAAAVAAVALFLAGCSGGDGGDAGDGEAATSSAAVETSATATESATESGTAAEEDVDLTTRETELGTIVTDGAGMTLYYFTQDEEGTDTSACTGECLEAWPIAVAAGDEPKVSEDVTGEVGTIDSPDGQKHLTLNGMPLYYFFQDKAEGDVLGQGVNDVWYVVRPDGEMVTDPAPGGSESGSESAMTSATSSE